ncbi:hypothetical protein pb186bvf_001785 [Paramecium bursaria]
MFAQRSSSQIFNRPYHEPSKTAYGFYKQDSRQESYKINMQYQPQRLKMQIDPKRSYFNESTTPKQYQLHDKKTKSITEVSEFLPSKPKAVISNAVDYLRERDEIMSTLMTKEEIQRILNS